MCYNYYIRIYVESNLKWNDIVTIKGYHATNRRNYEDIIENGFNRSKNMRNKHHWLGNGIYLFQYPKDAESWGKDINNCKSDPVILLVEASVEEDKFLDIDNPENMDKLKVFTEILLDKIYGQDIDGSQLNFENELQLISWALNQYKSVIETDLVKYTFTNIRTMKSLGYNDFTYSLFSKYKYRNTRNRRNKDNRITYPYNEVQYCLSENKNIINKQLYE